MKDHQKYEPVIGLEVHIQLKTQSKAFCGCKVEFGATANSNVCPVCLGQPGVLPVLNRRAFKYAVKMALALNCEMTPRVVFDRKHYYYPDLPKNYQISQHLLPIGRHGTLDMSEPDDNGCKKHVLINRVHLEEDAGKLIHDESGIFSLVDLNRTGVPLLEVVTEPCIASPEEAYIFLNRLKHLARYIGISDCNMEEGSLRCDVNLSMSPTGTKALGVKVEIKNMNSFKAVVSALEYEIQRQAAFLEAGEKMIQQTRLWDEPSGKTLPMRTKEALHDYRYFPEPDLVPFNLKPEFLNKLKQQLPELPLKRAFRFSEEYGLNFKEVWQLLQDKTVADYFEKTLSFAKKTKNAKQVYNWIVGPLKEHANASDVLVSELGFSEQALAELVELFDSGMISRNMAKILLDKCLEQNKMPDQLARELGMLQVSDESELSDIVKHVLSESEKAVLDYKAGNNKAISFIMGKVMAATKGKANPSVTSKLIKQTLDQS